MSQSISVTSDLIETINSLIANQQECNKASDEGRDHEQDKAYDGIMTDLFRHSMRRKCV